MLLNFYVIDAYEEVKTSVSEGKSLIATAVTGKGVQTAADDTFKTMASNIRSIKIGIDTSDATATSAQILSGYTAYAKGSKLTGTASTGYTRILNSQNNVWIPDGSFRIDNPSFSGNTITINCYGETPYYGSVGISGSIVIRLT